MRVSKFSVIIGDSLGAGNSGICRRASSSKMLWNWPNNFISVMGGVRHTTELPTVKPENIEVFGKKWSA